MDVRDCERMCWADAPARTSAAPGLRPTDRAGGDPTRKGHQKMHTPGPWEAIPPSERGTGHNWTIRAGRDICVAESGRWLHSDPHTESKANAQLIAAAPDLLAAAVDAENRLRGAGMIGGEDDLVCRAIAKATK